MEGVCFLILYERVFRHFERVLGTTRSQFLIASYLDKFIRSQDNTVSEPQHQVKGAEDKPQAMTTRETNDTPARLGHTPRGG